MKLITCPFCQCKTIGPDSREVTMGRWVGTTAFPLVFKCHSCTSSFKLTATGFNGLPKMPEAGPSTQPAVD